MALNVTNFFVPEVLAEAIAQGFAGMKALYGTGAAIVNTKMPAAKEQVGTSIKIPYFTNVGEWSDITNDGDPLTSVSLTSTPQTATVKQSGMLVERTQWSELAAYADGDPYEIAAKQIVEGAQRRIDAELITTATSATGWSSYTYDNTGNGAGTITYDAVLAGKAKWGDEQGEIALMVVHSKVFFDMLALKDTTGRPLVTDINTNGLSKFLGMDVAVSDRVPVNSGTYTNLLMKKGGLVAWVNGNPLQLSNNDPTKGTLLDSWHMFYTTHRYNPMAGFTKPGIIRLLTK